MKVHYNIEEAKYENGMLLVNGWMISGTEKNLMDNVYLIIKSASGLERRYKLNLFERKDVSQYFDLKYDNVGFSFGNSIKGFCSAKVYLEYELLGAMKRINVLKIQGDVKHKRDERLIVSHPEAEGFCSVENLEKIWLTDYKWLEPTDKEVDVIIPVYNGYQYFDKLFASVFNTNVRMHVIIINDCSPDERVQEYLEKLSQTRDNITLLNNETNLGFVKSVNKGLELSKNDVALVNTDVEVPENWLERLMYPIFIDETVASTTPYTNCGTLCSFPDMGKDNKIFDNKSVFFVDSVFRDLDPSYTELPTGVGFCMGMSRKAIEKVGVLDELNFGKGYGEENDWCQRAIEKGFRNVQVENLFVYHKHGGSFQSEEKKQLIETNMKKLETKHPNYLKDVAKFFEYDSNRRFRTYALFLCLMQVDAPSNLFFNHVLGGGANDYMVGQMKKLLASHEKCIEFAYNAYTGCYQIIVSYNDYRVKLHADMMDDLLQLLKLGKINNIYINELVTYPNADIVLKKIVEFKKTSQANMVMLGHDYYCVCPTINLLSKGGKYCYLECDKSATCLNDNQYIADLKYTDINQWRKTWKDFMMECDSVIVFSEDSKQILEKVYGKIDNLKVVPHKTDRMLKVQKRCKHTDTFNVAILGVLSERKGLSIVKDMLKHIKERNLPINIVIVGLCEEDIEGEHCKVTGKYTREQLPSLMHLYDIDLVFISSVWPETFSYTTEEAMKMDMPVATFNLGAPAERVRKYDKGVIINEMNAESAINTISKYAEQHKLPNEVGKSVLFIIEYKSFSSRYRVEHLREHLAYIGVSSKTLDIKDVDLDKILEYDVVSIYRCSDVEFVKKISGVTKQNGIKLLYEIDDFIFDYDKISYLEFLKTKEYENFDEYSDNICSCMELCDILTTSTNTLAGQMKCKFPDKQVIVCRNVACLEMQLLSEIAVDHDNKSNTDKVVLGYFSGSHTHNNDWLMIENAICDVMDNNEQVELMLVGALEVSAKLSAYESRITRVPFVDWQRLPALLRSIDINLMPLENELFHWCKSENKWMEAGLVGIPTVASRNPELEQIMTDGQDVLFCDKESDWQKNITALVTNADIRNAIGQNARAKVYNTHLVTSDVNFMGIEDVLSK